MKTFVIFKVRQVHLKKKRKCKATHFPADLVTLIEESLLENLISCAVTENFVFDLADAITGRKIFSDLTREEKHYYLPKHYCFKDQNSLLKKQYIKGAETKNLMYFADSKHTVECLQ